MAHENLPRAVALQALVVDVSARLARGERDDAIRAELLADGLPPVIVDHVFAVCEVNEEPRRARTALAMMMSGMLMIGMPLAGGVLGIWGAMSAVPLTQSVALESAKVEPVPADQQSFLGSIFAKALGRFLGELVRGSLSAFVGLLGFAAGIAAGLAVAVPVTRAISTWSVEHAITDDQRKL